MATYEELAPIIFGTGITRSQVETYFENLPEPADPPQVLEITSAKVAALANIFFEPRGIEKRNGLRKVAKEVGLSYAQCLGIIQELKVLKRAWDALQELSLEV